MCELSLSWDYVMDMTWREFQLRLCGHKRIQIEEWKKYRLVAHQVYASTPMKNKPVNIEKYLPLENSAKPSFTDAMKNRIRLEHKKLKEKWQMS